MSDHTHPELEDRITAEIAAMHTEIAAMHTELVGVHNDIVALRAETRQGFTAVTQVLGQILARLPEPDGDT